MGATDEELADFFEVSQTTVDNWKIKHPDFLGSLRQGKIEADSRVAQSLYERALGYEHPEEKIVQLRGEVVRVPTTKHYPPDTQAAALWLKNRRSNDWRETRHIQVASTQQTAVVILEPELVAKMDKAAGIVRNTPIEGECVEVEDKRAEYESN